MQFFHCFININAEGLVVGLSALFVICYQRAKSEEMFYISYIVIANWRCSANANASSKYKCLYLKIILNKCHLKVNKTQPPTCGWVTNTINWEPIKTNISCCELYLLAKERVRARKERKTEETLRGLREFHLFLTIFGGGSSLGGIIYCFQVPIGFITYSSYYSVELWITHKDSEREQVK